MGEAMNLMMDKETGAIPTKQCIFLYTEKEASYGLAVKDKYQVTNWNLTCP